MNDAFVPEGALDHEAIFEREGSNRGNEQFAVFKCPRCDHIYLLEYEVHTVYLDPTNLAKRVPIGSGTFECTRCGHEVPRGDWAGPLVESRFQVTWDELLDSEWAWVAKPGAGPSL